MPDERGEKMRTIASRLIGPLEDRGAFLSAILGVFVGALLGGVYEPRSLTHTVRTHRDGLYPDNRGN